MLHIIHVNLSAIKTLYSCFSPCFKQNLYKITGRKQNITENKHKMIIIMLIQNHVCMCVHFISQLLLVSVLNFGFIKLPTNQ